MTDQNFLDRTLKQFRRVLRFAGTDRSANLFSAVSEDLPDDQLPAVRAHVDACLEGRGGEVSARARAAELGEVYLTLSSTGRRRFLRILTDEYDVPAERVAPLIGAWQAADGPAAREQAQTQLRQVLVPPRLHLLQQFNGLDAGVKFLVDLRAELLGFAREDPALTALAVDLRELLASWFDVGFLDLERITWSTPASLLEKFIAYEAVHAIQSWDDLKHRLGEERRCYAFFHPRMPEEPLIFVQVALVRGMSDNIQALLDQDAPMLDNRDADTAIFYSISNCQAGLAGVSFGNFLIKRVASAIARDLPGIRTFATLSPIPGFGRWFRKQVARDVSQFAEDDVPPVLIDFFGSDNWAAVLGAVAEGHAWSTDESVCTALRPVLLRAAAHYLARERRGAQAADRVAHFHLTNGARIARINWLGDTSEHGMRQSLGLMVNYLYRLDEVDDNHELYSGAGTVSADSAVTRLLR